MTMTMTRLRHDARFRRLTAVSCALLAAGVALWWLDQTVPSVAAALLLFLSATLGIGHGATDVLLMRTAWPSRWPAVWANGLYAVAVVLGLALLLPYPALALEILLLLSVWHFGEGFGRCTGLTLVQRLMTRLAFGGAPVLLPAWLARPELEASLQLMFADAANVGLVMNFWLTLASAWLVALLAVAWMVVLSNDKVGLLRSLRPWLLELGALVMLYVLFSPLMAAALFFGIYHSGQHLRRVLGSAISGAASLRVLSRNVALWVTVGVSLALAAGTFLSIGTSGAATLNLSAAALQAWVVLLTAVSIPHVFLISYASAHLAPRQNLPNA